MKKNILDNKTKAIISLMFFISVIFIIPIFPAQAIGIPVLISPSNSARLGYNNPTFEWGSVFLANLYHIQLAIDSSFTNIVGEEDVAGTTLDSPPLPEDVYWWRVNARGKAGWGSYSEAFKFEIALTPPTVPVPISPENEDYIKDSTPRLEWNPSYDMSQTVGYYEVLLDDQATFASPNYNENTGTATEFTIPTPLSEITYYWKVRVRGDLGAYSSWSSTQSFTVDITAPGIPTLLSPSNGAIINVTRPLLDFNDVPDATGYISHLATDEDFVNKIEVVGFHPSYHRVLFDLSDGTFYWRIKATDEAFNIGPYSSVWHFTVDTTPPSPPDLLSPVDNEISSSDSIEFEWSSDSDYVEYELQIDNEGTFTELVLQEIVVDNNYVFNGMLDAEYYWRVRARDEVENWSDWSEVRVLTIDTTDPVVDSPEDITYKEGETGNIIQWAAADANADTYTIYLDGIELISDTWESGIAIEISVDDHSVGTYVYVIVVQDKVGHSSTDTIDVNVIEAVEEMNNFYPLIALIISITVTTVVFSTRKRKL